MNENKDSNRLDEEAAPKEPITKRIAKFSAFIYLALAITVVIVATVGIFSISYDYEEELPSVSIPDINFSQQQEPSLPPVTLIPDESKPIADDPVINEESGVDAEVDISQDLPKTMFYRPVQGEIIKNHSMDALVFSETMGDYRVHAGIDIAAEAGADVVSFADGVIASIEEDYFYGMTVSITHADGAVSFYKNLDSTLAENIKVGSSVSAGQIIGTVGNTARIENAEAPHLHFELTVNGVLVDPEPELPQN